MISLFERSRHGLCPVLLPGGSLEVRRLIGRVVGVPVSGLLLLAASLVATPAHAAGYVRSVEYVELAFPGAATVASVNLSKGQVAANCVPFASAMVDGTADAAFGRSFTDVSVLAGSPPSVFIQRGLTSGVVTVGVYVVEFDPAWVKVQQGTFAMADGNAGPVNVGLASAVSSLSRAALLFYHRNDTGMGGQGYDNVTVEGVFSATNQLRFQRNDTEQAIDGHWYVLEALNVGGSFAFTVQTKTITFTGAGGTAALTPSVDAAKSFVIGSYRSTETQDHPDQAALRLYLTGCAGSPSLCPTVAADQYQVGDGGTTSVTAYVLTFTDNVKVQRGVTSYTVGTQTTATATLATPVNTGKAMAWNGFAMGPGVMMADTGSGATIGAAHQRLKLVGPRTVQSDRAATDDIAQGSFEVVEWEPIPSGQMVMRSGRYTGDGVDDRAIYVGFQPDVVIVDREDLTTPNPNDEAVIRTSTMLGDLSKDMDANAGGNALGANRVQSLDPLGFTIGTDNNVNQNGIVYHWVAFKAAPGQLKLGTYGGTGVAQNITGVGFGPAYLLVISAGAHNVAQKSAYMPANFSQDFIALGYTNAILDVQTDGFRVGTNAIANNSGTNYHYVAWAPVPGRVAVGTYTGGAPADNRNITGTGFFPEWALLSRATNAAGSQSHPPVHKPASTGVATDWALLFDGTFVEANNIQNLQADGFQVGGHARVNSAGAPNTYYWAAFGPHVPQAYYRSIGTTADLTNQGTITVTAGSTGVSKVGGAGWKAQNRGRGDRLTVGTDHYIIASVDSDDALTLTAPAVTGYVGSTYTIARQFTTLQGWEDCVSRSAANTCKRPADVQEYFATASSSLVADDRSEVGIAYKDSVFTAGANVNVTIDGSTTDATHAITLTADAGNRHYGVAGGGVILDGGAATDSSVLVLDDYVTVEWLEIRGGGSGFDGVEWQSIAAANKGVARYLLIHNLPDNAIQIQDSSSFVDIYNNILYRNGGGIRNVSALSTGFLRIYNNTVFASTSSGGITGNVVTPNLILLRNNLALGNVGGDYNIPTPAAASSHNIASDATGTTHSPGGGGIDTVTATASPVSCPSGFCVGFNNITATTENLHLITTGYTNRALDTGADLSSDINPFDIDAQPRGTAWEIGADEHNPTTAVKLQAFDATPGNASIALAWRTGSELDNLGFHLYRATSDDGPWTRLTATLIPGLGSSAVGQAYAYRDAGLTNGVRYFYRLEDVDARSKATSHGPVSAVPSAAAAGDGDAGGSQPAGRRQASSSCPDWVLTAYGSATGTDGAGESLRCTRHGDPEATSFAVVSRDARSATLELRTSGFYALHHPASGTVRVFVPGFDFPRGESEAALPIRRALADAVVGRRVDLGGSRALDLQAYGLVPSALGRAEMQVGRDGTVRAGRRLTARGPLAFPRRELVTLLPSQFQGETKSAVVEIAPLRFDAARRRIVLARRVLVRLLFTGREAGESGRGSLGRAASRQAPPTGEVLARLFTSGRGLHAVSFEQLLPGRKRALPLSELRLERQGQPLAFHVEPATTGFGPGSRLYFHADETARSTDFTGEVAYELVHASGGVRMSLASAAPVSGLLASAPLHDTAFEANRYYQPGLLDAPDPWLWEALGSGVTRTVPFSLAGVAASGSATLDVYLQGASESGLAVDHHLSVSLNGALVGEARFAGKQPHRLSLGLPASLLREGANELALTSVADTGVSSLVFLDRFTIAHPQDSLAANGRFEGAWSESGSAFVSGLAATPALVDLTAAPRWLTGFELSAGALRFHAEAGHRYLVVSPEALVAPRVAAPEPSSLRGTSNQADYLLITPRAFLEAAQPLVERRADQGLAARTVAFEEIAAEFGHGRPSAEAIRAFLAFAFQSWARPSPRYVLLLGDSSYDPRNFMGSSPQAPLPALWTKTSYLWTASDPLLAAVNGDDALPDLAIGRLPASTAEQAQALVHKLIAWEDSGQGLGGQAALVADNPDLAGDFEADVRDVAASFLADRSPQLLLLGELGAQTRPRIQDALDSGLSFLSYVGHGGAAVWASENVWNSWDAPSLLAQSRQPLLVTMNCLNGYFVAPAYDSLAESLLKAEGRGAIAAFSPSGLSLDGPAHQYHRALMAALTRGRHARLGDAILEAQQAYAATGLMPELLSVYHLLGDPALRLR